MCGRYVSIKSHSDLVTLFGVSELSAAELNERGVALPSYNVAPTQQVAIVIDQRDKATGAIARAAAAARWGLVPSWARQIKGTPLINARVESAATKASFRKAFAARRCVFPALGYYEWNAFDEGQDRPRKQAYYLHPISDTASSFAGLYEWWRRPDATDNDPDRWLLSATILTTTATDLACPDGDVHDRTPVMLPSDRVAAWLEPDLTDPAEVGHLLTGLAPPTLEARPVTPAVGNVGNDNPDLIEALPAAAAPPLDLAYM